MKKLAVRLLSPFPNPFFFRDFNGKEFILDSDTREINGERISVENDPGGSIIVFGSWSPYAYCYSEFLATVERRKKELREKEQQRVITEQKRIDEAKKFNYSLEIPVQWSVEIKEVLSGLSASSNGDGYKRNTVRHIFIHEPLKIGRLERMAFTFLCSQPKTAADWSGTLGAGDKTSKVTCKSCLKIAARFSSSSFNGH